MLTIKCAHCKTKILKYRKIGKGKVLRCYKDRITRTYKIKVEGNKLKCENCGSTIGIIKDNLIDMNRDNFTYSGHKLRK